MDEKAKEKEAEWVQKKVDELSDALKKTVKAIRDYDIPVVEEAHYDERGLARDEWSPIRYYRVGKYDVDCRRIWKPSEGRGKGQRIGYGFAFMHHTEVGVQTFQ